MKKLCLLTLGAMLSIQSWAQTINDSISSKIADINDQNYQPAFRITAKEIAHLPFTSVMEIVNGAFPFAFSNVPLTTDHNFIVDGRILTNPNAINVSQIETIEYYPVAFTLQNGIRSAKLGTFVITTKTNANGFYARSLTGMAFGSKAYPYQDDNSKTDYTAVLNTQQEIGYGYNKNGLMSNTALGYTLASLPKYHMVTGYAIFDYKHTFDRLRLSNFTSYQASDKLKLDASIALASQKVTGIGDREDLTQSTSYFSTYKSDGDVFFWNIAAGAEYKINSKITNHLRFEYSNITNDQTQSDTHKETAITTYSDNAVNSNQSQFALTNELKGSFHAGPSFEFGWELLLRYSEQKGNSKAAYMFRQEPSQNPMEVGQAEATRSERSMAVMPRLSFGFAKQFYATAGATYDSWKNPYYGDPFSFQKLYPYAGLRWIMPKAIGSLSSLDIHSTYGTSWQDPVNYDYLDPYYSYSSYLRGPNVPGTGPMFFELGRKKRGYDWISGIDAAFANNKLKLSVNYIRGLAYPGSYGFRLSGPFYSQVYNELKHSGWSAGLQYQITDKEEFSLSMKAVLFSHKYELANGNDMNFQGSDPLINDHLPAAWRGSLQIQAGVKKFFMQANAMLRFNDGIYADPKADNHSLSHLVLGYQLNPRIGLSVQAKNLISVKQTVTPMYYGARYVGIGVVIGQ